MVPYVGGISGIEPIDLCADPDAGLADHLDDTERLVRTMEDVVRGHEALIAKAVALTEERCAAEKLAAVEAATRAAIQKTEERCANERRVAVEQAVTEVGVAAKEAQQAAIVRAIQMTEARCEEEKRIAVQAATINTQVSLGKPEDEALATVTASNFEQAAASAETALAAVSSLLVQDKSAAAAPSAPGSANPSESATKDETLHFF